jgi:hypothetical protein
MQITKKSKQNTVRIVNLESRVKTPNNIVSVGGLSSTENNSNPTTTELVRFKSNQTDSQQCIGKINKTKSNLIGGCSVMIWASGTLAVALRARGVHGLGKPNWSTQTHLIQPKKVGWVGLLGLYGFQNEKSINKIGFRAKPNPYPKNPLTHWIGSVMIFKNNFHIIIKYFPSLKEKNF